MADAATLERLTAEFPWFPRELLNILADSFIETGEVARALTQVRASAAYDVYFAGNRRDDGTLRLSEYDYYLYKERARVAIASLGVNPDLFGEDIVAALEGDVSINELEFRLDAAYERIIDRAPEVKAQWALYYGTDITDAAIVAMFISPSVSQGVLEGRIATTEIGAEAALRGFGLDLNQAERIRFQGISREQAAQVFGTAVEQLPILDVLAQRHADPDDDFDLNEFLSASIFDDPEQRRRIRRLVAQESALFSPAGGYRESREGALTGLLPG